MKIFLKWFKSLDSRFKLIYISLFIISILLFFGSTVMAITISNNRAKINHLQNELNKAELDKFRDDLDRINLNVTEKIKEKEKIDRELNNTINEKLKENSKIDDIVLNATDSTKLYHWTKFRENRSKFSN